MNTPKPTPGSWSLLLLSPLPEIVFLYLSLWAHLSGSLLCLPLIKYTLSIPIASHCCNTGIFFFSSYCYVLHNITPTFLFFASKRKEVRIGVSFCSCTRYFSIILIYNAQNTKVAYFGVVNFIPLHLVTWSILNPVFPSLKSECKPVNNSLGTKEINPFFT